MKLQKILYPTDFSEHSWPPCLTPRLTQQLPPSCTACTSWMNPTILAGSGESAMGCRPAAGGLGPRRPKADCNNFSGNISAPNQDKVISRVSARPAFLESSATPAIRPST